jgi:aspartate kinase
MNACVYKLGGTSQSISGYSKLVDELLKNTDKINFVVLSAISGVTNNLIKFTEKKDMNYITNVEDLCNNICNNLIDRYSFSASIIFSKIECNYKEKINKLLLLAHKYISDYDIDDIYIKSEIIGYGEILSTCLFSIHLESSQIKSKLLNSYDYIYSKKEIYQCNTQTEFYCKDLSKVIEDNIKIYIMQGFIGSTPSNKKIVLGRGGSDTTGALVAKTLNAQFYEVWTDVDGIYTGDPRIFPNSYLVEEINYEMCQELSAMGAKVMHPLSIKPCADMKIPIYVKNTYSDSKGTKICDNDYNDIFYALQKNQTVFKIKSLNMWNSYGFVTDIFRKFSENRIDINIVTTSQFSISATTSESNLYKLMEIRDNLSERYDVQMINNCTILSFVTKNIKKLINKINYDCIEPEIIHISDNNMTLNVVLKEFEPKIIDIIISL